MDDTGSSSGFRSGGVKLHARCLPADKPCVRRDGELAITLDGRCAGCTVKWWLADPAGTRRTPNGQRSEAVN